MTAPTLPKLRRHPTQLLRAAITAHSDKWKSGPKGLYRTRLLFGLAPIVALFIVEILNEKNPFLNLDFTETLMNLIWYVIVLFALWIFHGRRRRAAAVYIGLFTMIGIVNHFVVEYRGRILLPADIVSWRTAANVSSEYSFAPDAFMIGAGALAFAYLVLVKFFMLPQQTKELFRRRWLNWALSGLCAAYIFAFFFTPWLPAAGVKAELWRTQSNGFTLNFTLALRYSRVDKPEGYSVDVLTSMTDDLLRRQEGNRPMTLYSAPMIHSPFEAKTYDKSTVPQEVLTITPDMENGIQPTNIICIMDESFADMAIFDTLKVDGDTMPYYHRMRNNTIKGWMYSPVTGAGTANVEYEFLTGNSVSVLPAETTAYELYVKKDMPSLISWAESLGFSTTTMHPYFSSGWNRPLVYSYFGVQRQLYDTDFILPSYTRGYISDSSDFEKIESLTTQAGGDKTFIFNVTMQNHGGYQQGWNNLQRKIALNGTMTGCSSYTEQYLNLVHKSDEQLHALLEYYAKVKEPTLIVMFGDHQGKLSTWFYENKLYAKPMDERTLEELQRLYVTPFFLWANYDIPEAQDVMLSTNYLGTLLAKVSNYPTTGYMEFLNDLYDKVPMVNTQGYIEREGTLTDSRSDLNEEQQEKLLEYDYLNYYNLFTKKRNEAVDSDFFRLK